MALSNAKQKLQDTKAPIAPTDDGPDVIAPRAKRRKLSARELDVFTSDEKRKIIYSGIRLPRPLSGNLVYSAAEAVNVVRTVTKQNDIGDNGMPLHPKRLFLVLVKEKMINERRSPVLEGQTE